MDNPNIPEKTLELVVQDVLRVLEKQKEEREMLISQVNILFFVNTALLSFVTISKLLTTFSTFSIVELLLFLINFTLLIRAVLPRTWTISPNLNISTDKTKSTFPENYWHDSPQEYQVKMIANWKETYNINQEIVNDISQALKYANFVTSGLAMVALLHQVKVYFLTYLQKL